MKVLMFGWEFPPNTTGGLGTACYGLTKELTKLTPLSFVLPTVFPNPDNRYVRIISPHTSQIRINSLLQVYHTSQQYTKLRSTHPSSLYGNNLFQEVERYGREAIPIAHEENPDVIHAHDWLTFRAGIEAKRSTHKPLIVHIHATEFDRSGGSCQNPKVHHYEQEGLDAADAVITVSEYTKRKLLEHYRVEPAKIKVIHNGVLPLAKHNLKKLDKTVLFMGRLTLQKGPDYFLKIAERVLSYDPGFKFIIAGTGDMESQLMHRAAECGISDKVLFTGFLKGKDIERIFSIVDVFVMPSVSEPFGITLLEAMSCSVPSIVSKQSGVSEVVRNCLKCDFWDIDKTANLILSMCHYPIVHNCLSLHGQQEARKYCWKDAAHQCMQLYKEVAARG